MSQLAGLADDLGVNERTLRRAAGQGTLRAERLSPRRMSVAPGEARYLRRHWPLLAALRRALRTEPNVAFAMLFGSVARGDDHADSDVDLMVVLREHSLTRMVEFQGRLEQTLGRKVDVLSVEAASANALLLAMAVEEGRVLVDRSGLWTKLRSELDGLRLRAVPLMKGKEAGGPRPVDLRRWKKEIAEELANLPREHEALEYAMAEFGTNFELEDLKKALEPKAEIALYSRVQALERAVTRIQNILAGLAIAGAELGGLPLPGVRAGVADRSFEALKEGGVIGAALCRRLRNAQRARNLIEHDYGKVSAGQLHEVTEDIRRLSLEFVRPFRDWVDPQL